jgi:hypothetical protein
MTPKWLDRRGGRYRMRGIIRFVAVM